MHKIHITNGFSGGSPLANVLAIILGAIVIGVSIVLGFFAFLALSAVILVAASAIAVKSWWARRRSPASPEFIEGEFHVVKKDKTS